MNARSWRLLQLATHFCENVTCEQIDLLMYPLKAQEEDWLNREVDADEAQAGEAIVFLFTTATNSYVSDSEGY